MKKTKKKTSIYKDLSKESPKLPKPKKKKKKEDEEDLEVSPNIPMASDFYLAEESAQMIGSN